MDRLYQLEQRVLMLELALQKQGILVEEFPPSAPTELESEEYLTPKQLRANGNPYCPKCYTFGDTHRRDCIYAGKGMQKHIRTPIPDAPK